MKAALSLFAALLVLLAALAASAQSNSPDSAKKQANALDSYRAAVDKFELVLRQRRAQVDSHQPLPNLPGQALYLARNDMISACKDLSDVLPSRIGRPNKFGIPPAYLDADNERLLDEYRK